MGTEMYSLLILVSFIAFGILLVRMDSIRMDRKFRKKWDDIRNPNKNSYEYARSTYEQTNQEKKQQKQEYQQKQEESQKSEPMGEYARYRSILGVSTSSTWEEVKLAYRRLAMKHHPDRGGDIKIFQDLQHAYQKLEVIYR